MSEAMLVFKVYLLVSSLLSASEHMGNPSCFNTTDKLMAIDAYAYYTYQNDTYHQWIKNKEMCVFKDTAFITLNSVNQTEKKAGNFTPTFDYLTIMRASASGGKFN